MYKLTHSVRPVAVTCQ